MDNEQIAKDTAASVNDKVDLALEEWENSNFVDRKKILQQRISEALDEENYDLLFPTIIDDCQILLHDAEKFMNVVSENITFDFSRDLDGLDNLSSSIEKPVMEALRKYEEELRATRYYQFCLSMESIIDFLQSFTQHKKEN